MEKNTQPSLATNLIIVGEGAAPILLCTRHSEAMIQMLKTADVPFASYGLDCAPENTPADTALVPEDHMCQACNLTDELSRPRIIISD